MTKQAELRFVCNRCRTEQIIPLQNTAAIGQLPNNWGLLKAGVAETEIHLCTGCVAAFGRFMMNEPDEADTQGQLA